MSALEPTCVRVLIADDSSAVRERLCELLEEDRRVHVVGQAASAGEAWTLFEREQPAAVVLDLHFQDGSGLDLLQNIKRAQPGCLVLVLTNHDEPVLREECRRRGADHVLHKATEFERVSGLLGRPARVRPESRGRAHGQPVPRGASEKTPSPFRFAPTPGTQPGLPLRPCNLQPARP